MASPSSSALAARPQQQTPSKRLRSPGASSVKGATPSGGLNERCPSCDRHFGPKAYDRHVEWCRERRARIQVKPSNQAAKERLQARIKYQVPALKKSPLALVREKYRRTPQTDSDTKLAAIARPIVKEKSSPSVEKPSDVTPSRVNARIERIGDGVQENKMDAKSSKRASKINDAKVNEALEDLTVASLRFNGRKLVTWRDTVRRGGGEVTAPPPSTVSTPQARKRIARLKPPLELPKARQFVGRAVTERALLVGGRSTRGVDRAVFREAATCMSRKEEHSGPEDATYSSGCGEIDVEYRTEKLPPIPVKTDEEIKIKLEKDVDATVLWASRDERDAKRLERDEEARQKLLRYQKKLQEEMRLMEETSVDVVGEDSTISLSGENLHGVSNMTFVVATDSTTVAATPRDASRRLVKRRKRARRKFRMCVRCLSRRVKSKMLVGERAARADESYEDYSGSEEAYEFTGPVKTIFRSKSVADLSRSDLGDLRCTQSLTSLGGSAVSKDELLNFAGNLGDIFRDGEASTSPGDRHRILKIAAEEFIRDTRSKKNAPRSAEGFVPRKRQCLGGSVPRRANVIYVNTCFAERVAPGTSVSDSATASGDETDAPHLRLPPLATAKAAVMPGRDHQQVTLPIIGESFNSKFCQVPSTTDTTKNDSSFGTKDSLCFCPSTSNPQMFIFGNRQNSTAARMAKVTPKARHGDTARDKKIENVQIGDGGLKAEELFPEGNRMYEEYKKYEEMYLEERQKKSASRKRVPKVMDLGINLEMLDNASTKPGYDSAYGSLKTAPKELETSPNLAQPKFCHECGTKYPVSSARFCIECGVKRLIL